MKNRFFFFLILFSHFLGFSQSSAVEFEIIRTKEAPGFFLLKIFTSDDLPPIKKRNVFIKNFKKSETIKYKPILEIIEDLGGIIEDKEFLRKKKLNDDIFVLGAPLDLYKNFDIKKQDVVKDFEAFQQKNIENVYLENLQLSFGGNISDVHIKNEKLTDKNPINIIGKFLHPRKTRIEIKGISQKGEISLSSNLPLDEKNRSNDPLAEYLPELWEKTKKITTSEEPPKDTFQIFPLLLFSSGAILILFVLIFVYKEKKSQKKNIKLISENSPTNIKKSSEMMPPNLPFEIEFNSKSKK